MSSQILRPRRKGSTHKSQDPFVIQGPWGRREYPPGTVTDLYNRLFEELVQSGLLGKGTLGPSRKYHGEVTDLIHESSFIDGKWVRDDSFGRVLKQLREERGLTQEGLSEKSREVDPAGKGVPVPTIRGIEQGQRTQPYWDTVCLLAAALGCGLNAFARGTTRP